jgi:hypothetical protein
VDPIHPITPRPPAILPVGPSRVQPASRERPKESSRDPRDRFTKADEDEAPGREREQPREPPMGEPNLAPGGPDGQHAAAGEQDAIPGQPYPAPGQPHATPGEEPPAHIDVRA